MENEKIVNAIIDSISNETRRLTKESVDLLAKGDVEKGKTKIYIAQSLNNIALSFTHLLQEKGNGKPNE